MGNGTAKSSGLKGYIIAVVVFLLFVSLSLFVFFYCVQRDVEANIRQTVTENVERQSYHFNSLLSVRYEYLEGIAACLGSEEELVSEKALSMISLIGEKSELERVAIIEANGTAHYDSGDIKNVADRNYFKTSMQGIRSLSNPLESVLDGVTRVILGVPIYRGEEIIGVLGGSFNVGALSRLLFEDLYGGAGDSFIVAYDGEIIAHDAIDAFMKTEDENNFFDFYGQGHFFGNSSVSRLREDFENQSGGCMRIRLGKETQYLSYAPLNTNGWMLCYVVPLETAEEPYKFIRSYEMILIYAFAAAIILLMLGIYRMNSARQNVLLHNAQMDALTGVYNKKSTEEEINQWLEKEECERLQVFLMVDIDKYKEINDRYGHAVGDEVLREIGAMLRRFFREGDIIGRIGGDEFVILMKNVNTEADAELKTEALCEAFRSLHHESWPADLRLTCSMGMAFSPWNGSVYMELYQCADKALYETKQRGRNGYTNYQAGRYAETAEKA